MSKLFLASSRTAVALLRAGNCCPVMGDNRSVWYAQAYLRDLVALNWRFKCQLNQYHWDDDGLLLAACDLMMVTNVEEKIEGSHQRLRKFYRLRAVSGDMIVVLPVPPKQTPGIDSIAPKAYLESNPVWIFYVGSAMDEQVAGAYQNLDWKLFKIPAARDVGTIKERHPGMTLTVSDIERAIGNTDAVKQWQSIIMPDRDEIRLAEIFFNRETSIGVEEILRHKFKAIGIETETYSDQTEAFCSRFGLSNIC